MILECKDGNFAVIDVALVIAVGELRRDIPQVALPTDSQHSAQNDCVRGVLPFTKTNFMRHLLMRKTMCAGPLIARLKFDA